jgi:TPR repeat protein
VQLDAARMTAQASVSQAPNDDIRLRQAAEQGDARAQFSLALMLESGEGVAQDLREAAKWYQRAAEQGEASAQFNLGLMYANGRGVALDDARAIQWFRKATTNAGKRRSIRFQK